MIVPAADSNMSFTVRKALVDALFASFGIMVLGAAAGLCLAAIAYFAHEDAALVLSSLLIVAISGVRLVTLESYRRHRSSIADPVTLRRWELVYLAGSVATLGTFGTLAAISETLYPSSIFTYACLVTVMGATVSVGARNYASRRVVIAATCASCIPAAGAALASAYYHQNYPAYILTLLIVFIASTSQNAHRDKALGRQAFHGGVGKRFPMRPVSQT